MPKRQNNILLGLVALLLGAMLYILFQENTWVSQLFAQMVFRPKLWDQYPAMNMDWLCYYIPDFLCAFSLTCGIQAVCLPKTEELFGCAVIVLVCGTLWEIFQWCGVISGTGDFWDVLMYLSGSTLSILMNIKERKQT